MSEPIAKVGSDGSIGRIGRYALLQDLAKGGMAQVFIAQKDGASEICVLKQLLLELEEHEIAGKRFHREAHVASFLNHPNIARITDAGMEDNTFCIAFEFIPGKDAEAMMHKLLPQGRMLPYEVSLAFAVGVLKGLAYAHEAKDPEGRRLGLVHRDLSPRNMMLSFDGEVKIIDFGLAHGAIGDFKTAPGMVLGTLRYVSPEQALTDPIDRRSDLYSLSVVLHELLTGRWVVQPGKPFDVLKGVVSDVPPLVTELNPHLPRALGPVIAKGMAKQPDDRFQTAAAYLDALLEAAGELANTPEEALGEFVTELFPEEAQRARRVISLGRQRFEANLKGVSLQSVRPVDLVEPDSEDSRTRTGFMDPTRLGEGMVEPSELTRTADPSQMTRTAFGSELSGGSDATLIAPRALVDSDALTTLRDGQANIEEVMTAVPTVLAGSDDTFVVDRTHAPALAGPTMIRYSAPPRGVTRSGAKKTRSYVWLLVGALALALGLMGTVAYVESQAVDNQPMVEPLPDQQTPKGFGVVQGQRDPEPMPPTRIPAKQVPPTKRPAEVKSDAPAVPEVAAKTPQKVKAPDKVKAPVRRPPPSSKNLQRLVDDAIASQTGSRTADSKLVLAAADAIVKAADELPDEAKQRIRAKALALQRDPSIGSLTSLKKMYDRFAQGSR